MERLAEMERQRRQREAEQRLVEEETAKRIEELVNKRVEDELEKRKDEIEREVAKRVEEAKQIMERQMMEEMEKRREKQLLEEKHREVRNVYVYRKYDQCGIVSFNWGYKAMTGTFILEKSILMIYCKNI